MLLLDGVYVERPDGSMRFHWVKAPSGTELTRLTQMLARRIGRHLERQGLLERDAENSHLAGDGLETGPMEQLLGSSITYRIAVGPQQGRKVFTLQTLPACDELFDDGVGKVAGFSLHAGVAARADRRQKLELLCRYISRRQSRKNAVAHPERRRLLSASTSHCTHDPPGSLSQRLRTFRPAAATVEVGQKRTYVSKRSWRVVGFRCSFRSLYSSSANL